MKKILAALVVLACTGLVANAQTPATGTAKNPVTDMIRQVLERSAKNTIAAADEMPADKYSYKPTPEQIEQLRQLREELDQAQDELTAAFRDGWTIGSITAETFAINFQGRSEAQAWLATIERSGPPPGA